MESELPELWREHFPKPGSSSLNWRPYTQIHALASRVLAVAITRVEGTWSAYCDAVPGENHKAEADKVLRLGDKLLEPIALVLFPEMEGVPYAL